ncbi:hypothetical protein LUX39_10610 [Actinomadura madurae]|nr:hypothetical protein [Actinomadura madurae]MCQ0014173.1 hypothetical protein [Actinomadura madurae]
MREAGDGLHDMLAVVQDEQRPPPVQRRDQPFHRAGRPFAGRRAHPALAQPERAEQRLRHLGRDDRRQVDEVDLAVLPARPPRSPAASSPRRRARAA